MTGIDPFIAILGGSMILLSVLAGWSTVRFELDMATHWRIAKYVSSVLALVLGFGFCQALAAQFAAARGLPADSVILVLAGAVVGSFLVMWGVQAVEYALRRRYGLEPLPYRLVRFDLFR